MMGSISAATDIGTMNAVLYGTTLTSQAIAKLAAQASSGLIAPDYAGLGADAGVALDLTGQLALNKATQSDATRAADLAQVAQAALKQIQTLTSGFTSQLLSPAGGSSTGLPTLVASANAILHQVASLLNTKVGDIYVFAGQDSRTPPIPDPSNITGSAFFTAISTAVAALDVRGTALVQTQTLAASQPGVTSPFAPTLEASNQPAVAGIGDGETIQPSVQADRNTNAVSVGAGTSSTGSYTRDILMSLATVASLTTANSGDPLVASLLGDTQTVLTNALGALNTDIGGLGARQQTITAAQGELVSTATVLTEQLGGVQSADPAAVATKLSELQIQLQASYKIIASLEGLSLVKFL